LLSLHKRCRFQSCLTAASLHRLNRLKYLEASWSLPLPRTDLSTTHTVCGNGKDLTFNFRYYAKYKEFLSSRPYSWRTSPIKEGCVHSGMPSSD
jgi:hypothetical protein